MKKVIKYIIACLLVCLIANTGKAQNTNPLYFMDNIAERNNINPAFTPNCNFYLDFIFLPNMYMNFGNNNFIFNDFLYNQNGQTSLFLNSQQSIDNFYNSLNPSTEIKFNFGLNILSFGFKVKKHYFTFDMGVNAEAYAYIPRDIFKLALYGAQDPHNINKFDFSTLGVDATLYSKVGLGYMYQINNKWQIGVKAKFLMGYANINTQINKMELGISRQSWTLETDGAIKASLPLHFNTNEDGSLDVSSLSMLGTNELISLLYNSLYCLLLITKVLYGILFIICGTTFFISVSLIFLESLTPSSNKKSTSCTKCSTVLTACTECTDLNTCTACQSGYYLSGGKCHTCGAGTYISGTTCVSCPKDTYNPWSGQYSCTSCPTGATTTGTGATSSSECQTCTDGQSYINGECVTCSEVYGKKCTACDANGCTSAGCDAVAQGGTGWYGGTVYAIATYTSTNNHLTDNKWACAPCWDWWTWCLWCTPKTDGVKCKKCYDGHECHL